MAASYEEYKGYASLCFIPGHACTDRFKKELMDVFCGAVVHLYRCLCYEGSVSKHRLLMDDSFRQDRGHVFEATFCLHKVSLCTNQMGKQLGDDRNACISSELMDGERHICAETVVVILLRWRLL